MSEPEWLAPRSLEEALELRAEHGDEATVVAGGTFIAILLNQRLLAPRALLALRGVPELAFIEANGELRLGALTTHRAVELHPDVRARWPGLAHCFSLVASPRVRNQATVGGVLADADYASDPPALLTALGARVLARSRRGEREIPLEELIVGHYETSLEPRRADRRGACPRRRPSSRLPQVPLAHARGPPVRGRRRRGAGRGAARRRGRGRRRGLSTSRTSAPWPTASGPTESWPPRSAAATPRRSTRSPTCAARPSTAGA